MLARMETFDDPLSRSPELMSADDTGLLVVDVQEKLIRLLPGHERLVWSIGRLIDGAKLFKLPVLATEQYPRGLGPTVPELISRLDPAAKPHEKTAFSCLGCKPAAAAIERLDLEKWLVAGIETHVCVQQSVMDMLSAGYEVFVAVDAVGSRGEIDHRTALRRMESAGATLCTVEAALFEWCGDSSGPKFKQLSQMIKDSPTHA